MWKQNMTDATHVLNNRQSAIGNLQSPIVLYDGVCGLCNRVTQFLLKHDQRDLFRYASLQSDFAKKILLRHGADPAELDTVCVVLNYETPQEKVLVRSDAVLYLGRELGGIWGVMAGSRVIPRFIRDAVYNLVASNRYKVFGKYETCMLPEPRHRNKFLDTV
jgi:predicted DCC family thiol-disulfide oxidoreductase YuxK